MKRFTICLLAAAWVLLACSKDDPVTAPGGAENQPDTGGTHKAMPLGSDDAPYGYYVYTPSSYKSDGPAFPLLIFLHGSGERGDSQTTPADLDKILVNGPPNMIQNKTWSPKHPMIVVSPQCHEGWWDRDHVRAFIKFISTTYRVDQKRIYLTGLSMGGYGTFDQLNSFDDNQIAAAVPIAGSGVMNAAFTARIAKVPIWVFHGEDDTTVFPDFSKAIVPAVNALNPKVRAKLTLYPGVGHNSWKMTYTGSGMGKEDPAYDPFNMDIYDWMYQYTKP